METKKRKIIILGGSFNPPTIAHYKLLKNAIDALNADLGLFVPVSDAYLKRRKCDSNKVASTSYKNRKERRT